MRTQRIAKRAGFLAVFAASAVTLALSAASASAAGQWQVHSLSNPTVAPGAQLQYLLELENVGDTGLPAEPSGNAENCVEGAPPPATLAKCFRFKATFPTDITPLKIDGGNFAGIFPIPLPAGFSCSVSTSGIACEAPGNATQIGAHTSAILRIVAQVDPGAAGHRTASFEVSGAGVPSDNTLDSTLVTGEPPQFGIADFDGQAVESGGDIFTQAAGHPYALSTQLEFNSYDNPNPFKGTLWPVEPIKDIVVDVPPGLLGNPSAVGRCTAVELSNGFSSQPKPLCPPSSQVGTTTVRWNISAGQGGNVSFGPLPLFNMVPPSGSPARFGFNAFGTIVSLDAKLRSKSDYSISIFIRNISEGLATQSSDLTFWGAPADEAHLSERACPGSVYPTFGGSTCSAGVVPRAFLRLPTTCTDPGEGLEWTAKVDSWFDPGAFDANGDPNLSDPAWDTAAYTSHEPPGWPAAPEDWGPERGVENCEDVPIHGTLDAQPTSIDTETSTGLNVHVEVPNQGLENPTGIASSDLKKVRVTLPQGVTINPSQAEGLGVCSPSQYESTELSFFPTPGTGCPDDSKIGTVKVVTPLLEETLEGDVFIAQQDDPTTSTPGAENPFDSLLAIYIVLREPQRGILVKLPGEVTTDEKSGRIVTTFDDLPQLPFSSFDFKFREGARAPLVTPPTCGSYETTAEFWGHSDPDGPPLVSTSSFEIVRGVGGGACPPAGTPAFRPGFTAGTINNNAGSFSPFNMRLTRLDGDQNLTKFSAVLPPGVLAKLAGVEQCSEAAIAAAKGKTGRAELASPSCPANSQIGRTLAGAGVGSVLTYVPGKIYLAGPHGGSPISIVAITPAVAGPFDVGTVVVRMALSLDPRTGEARVDGAASDPIPHMLEGIPLKLRDLRVYVDRPEFTLNATSCDPSAVGATLWGSAADVFNPADDVPVALSSRYQAASCASLGFKPRLSIRLFGPPRRAAFPKLKAVVRTRPGDANIGRAAVTLPNTELLENSHIRTICTRVQYAAEACPPASVYGYAKAFTPLLDEPLEGPVYLRSSSHQLPDMVASLDGLVHIDLVGKIDSTKGRIRATFEDIPDAAVSKFVLTMQGGKKGLLVNGANLCKSKPRARALFDGQNGKPHDFHPRVRASCGKRRPGRGTRR